MKTAQLYPKPAIEADVTNVQKMLKNEENYH
jgi:hypothetical protein